MSYLSANVLHDMLDLLPFILHAIITETLSKLKLIQVTKHLDLDLAWNNVNLKLGHIITNRMLAGTSSVERIDMHGILDILN